MMTDKFVRDKVGEILKREVTSSNDWSVVGDILTWLTLKEFQIEIFLRYDGEYCVTVGRWVDGEDVAMQDTAFAVDKNLVKCFYQVLVKAGNV